MRTTQDAHPSFTRRNADTSASLPASRARVQVFHRWFCPDGAYLVQHPDAARIARWRAPRVPQAERLPGL